MIKVAAGLRNFGTQVRQAGRQQAGARGPWGPMPPGLAPLVRVHRVTQIWYCRMCGPVILKSCI